MSFRQTQRQCGCSLWSCLKFCHWFNSVQNKHVIFYLSERYHEHLWYLINSCLMICISSNQIHLIFYKLPSSLLEGVFFGPFCLYFLLLTPEFKVSFSTYRCVADCVSLLPIFWINLFIQSSSGNKQCFPILCLNMVTLIQMETERL